MRLSFKAAALAAALLSLASGAQAASEHTNDVNFNISGVQYFSFTESGHSITSGQPYGGASGSVKDGLKSAKIVVTAGRKSSSDVASWFKSEVGDGKAVAARSLNPLPGKLNFAVAGTLVIRIGDQNTVCDNVIVAQGHAGSYNDWWIGGPYMKTAKISNTTDGVMQTCHNGLVPMIAIFTWAGRSNWFTISLSPL